jgi:large subunit ribosomal protein L1
MHKRSKLYRARLALFDRQKLYALPEGIALLKKMPVCKFDETVEIACRLGVDTRQSDQVVRGAVSLPHGTGKSVRVVVIASGETAQKAQEAGADHVGFEELLERVKGGWLDFDVMVATPAAMQKVRTLGKVLGPRGLMPNPKTGTVTDDTAAAVREAKAGRVEYRADRGGCVHVPVGKLSFPPEKLVDNTSAVLQAILRARPQTVKGSYLLSATVSSTMSPGVKVDVRDLVKA